LGASPSISDTDFFCKTPEDILVARFGASCAEGAVAGCRLGVAAVDIAAGLSTMPELEVGLKYESMPVCVSMRMAGFGAGDGFDVGGGSWEGADGCVSVLED